MKLHKIFLGCAAALALVSCVSEDLSKVGGKDAGRLEIGVETQEPLKTRAGEYTVTNFPVTIYEADGTTKVQSFETVSAMPAQILLPVGNYVLEAHTPGVMERIMNAPYYKGSEPSEILKDATTQSTITCRMANTSVTVHYDQDFLDLFTSWTITFDDGTDNALSFTNDDGDTPAALYWDLGDGVEKLTVNFRGVNKDGTITAKNALTKSQATETYDGQNTNFAGGDAVVVNSLPWKLLLVMSPSASHPPSSARTQRKFPLWSRLWTTAPSLPMMAVTIPSPALIPSPVMTRPSR